MEQLKRLIKGGLKHERDIQKQKFSFTTAVYSSGKCSDDYLTADENSCNAKLI